MSSTVNVPIQGGQNKGKEEMNPPSLTTTTATTTTTTTRGTLPKLQAGRHAKKRPRHNNDNNNKQAAVVQQHALVQALRLIDPILQFLCKATGQVLVDVALLRKSLPVMISTYELQALQQYGVLRIVVSDDKTDDDKHDNNKDEKYWKIGFPPPPLTTESTTTTTTSTTNNSKKSNSTSAPSLLHGATKRGAQQRLAWLQEQLLLSASSSSSWEDDDTTTLSPLANKRVVAMPPQEFLPCTVTTRATKPVISSVVTPEPTMMLGTTTRSTDDLSNNDRQVGHATSDANDDNQALRDLKGLFNWTTEPATTKNGNDDNKTKSPSRIPRDMLPHQVSYAGSQQAQPAVYAKLPTDCFVPKDVYDALVGQRHGQLYRHQVEAIVAALVHRQHVSITTGTGSGKSLAFLMPVISTLVQSKQKTAALLLFPTKALAQDQMTKLQHLAARLGDFRALRPATLDGDTPHSQRRAIAESANLILTNPDTLHAAILPNWEKKGGYAPLLAKLAFCVVDEAHSYQGIFGAHVALILARLRRVCAVARARREDTSEASSGIPQESDTPASSLRFIAASATLPWPEIHVRKLCPIGANEHVAVIDSDTSPRAAKHFFVWNPPLLSAQGASSGRVVSIPPPLRKNNIAGRKLEASFQEAGNSAIVAVNEPKKRNDDTRVEVRIVKGDSARKSWQHKEPEWHRRHAADETALLLARAVAQGVRCMAFAKTRNLVEWIFERTLAALRSDPLTSHLTDKVESYRGGYTRAERRKIEERLFRNELLGVVGTNALELGVDVGGIDLTLHCGYPSSYASLLQQAGRAGRGKSHATSCSIVVCFNSPSEQHLWRHPSSLLSKGVTPTDTIPLGKSVVQSHLLCASNEFPLTGSFPAESIVTEDTSRGSAMSDWNLFGGQKVYEDALEELKTANSVATETIYLPFDSSFTLYKAHPLMKKAWSLVSIRSIEPVNYNIVDLSHPAQGNRTDGVYSEEAVLDILPYSRVFYHAHPGAIITHRGTRYKVVSMTRPPEITSEPYLRFRKNMQLSAFAKPASAKYSTRPLSIMHVTIVKQLERVELSDKISNGTMQQQEENAATEEETRSEASGAIGNIVRVGMAKVTRTENDPPKSPDRKGSSTEEADEEICVTSFSGCGVVNVKRTVHGYKKLSLITRTEISRSELSLPDMEFETFGLWFDTEPQVLEPSIGAKYGEGVHALSHALLAVAPLFESGLVRDDLECDHSFYSPTRLVLFDERAGGSGACERLWKHFFVPHKNILDAALDLLNNCDTCVNDGDGYEGGCPACLHAPQCLKFNMNLCRSAAIVVGNRLLDRIKTTSLYMANEKFWNENKQLPPSPSRNLTPRRKARYQALKKAKEMRSAQTRQFVVGRPSFVRTEGGSLFCGDQQEHG